MLGTRRQGSADEKQDEARKEKRDMEAKVAPARRIFAAARRLPHYPDPWPANPALPKAPSSRHLDAAYGGKGIADVTRTATSPSSCPMPSVDSGCMRVSLCKRRHAEARITAVLKRAPGES